MSDLSMTVETQDSPAKAAPRAPFTLTTEAARHIAGILEQPDFAGTVGLRLGVAPHGCSGLSYSFEPVQTIEAGEESTTSHGVTLIFNPLHLMFLVGTEIDWHEDALESGFVFSNPNEKGRCGCGESFHV